MKQVRVLVFSIAVAITAIQGCVRAEKYNLSIVAEPELAVQIIKPGELENASAVIKDRLVSFGIREEMISFSTENGRIIIKISEIDTADAGNVTKIITQRGKASLMPTYDNKDIFEHLVNANSVFMTIPGIDTLVKEESVADTSSTEEDMILAAADSAAQAGMREYREQNPLFALLQPNIRADGEPFPGSAVGLAVAKDTSLIIRLLNMDIVRFQFPLEMVLCWSRDPYKYDPERSLYELHALRDPRNKSEETIDGSSILKAGVSGNRTSFEKILHIELNEEGSKAFSDMTAGSVDKSIALVIDNRVISSPRVASAITGGKIDITGDFSTDQVRVLTAILNNGNKILPFPLKIAENKISRTE